MRKEIILPTITAIVLTTSLMIFLYSTAWVGALIPRIGIIIGIGLVSIGSAMVGIGVSKLASLWANTEEYEDND